MSTASDRRKVSWQFCALMAFLCAAVLMMACTVIYYRPRQLVVNPNYFLTYYGLGWHDQPGLSGKNWIGIRVDEGADGWWEVKMDGSGYGYFPYRGYYANGTLKDEGVCLVEKEGEIGLPFLFRDHVLHGKYFDPKGNVISQIRNGTGRQILCYADGTKSWELELRNGKRVEHILYWPTGAVMNRCRYGPREMEHGVCIRNYEDDTPKTRGRKQHGKEVGTWYRFHPDGSVEMITDNSRNPPIETEYEVGEKFLDPAILLDFEIE